MRRAADLERPPGGDTLFRVAQAYALLGARDADALARMVDLLNPVTPAQVRGSPALAFAYAACCRLPGIERHREARDALEPLLSLGATNWVPLFHLAGARVATKDLEGGSSFTNDWSRTTRPCPWLASAPPGSPTRCGATIGPSCCSGGSPAPTRFRGRRRTRPWR